MMFYKKIYFLVVPFSWFIISGAFAQVQKVADSLRHIYKQDTAEGTEKLKLLLNLSFNEVKDYKEAIRYAEELISLSQQAGNDKYLSAGYSLKGTKERLLGNLDKALAAILKSAEISKRLSNRTGEGNAYVELGDAYSAAKNHPTAMLYYNKAIATLRKTNDSNSIASALSNIGDEFVRIKKPDSALLYFNEAKIIFDKIDYLSGKGYSLGNIGVAYANIGKNNLAEKNINEAIQILEEAGDYYPICDYLLSMTDVYSNRRDRQPALNYALRSLSLAEKYKLKEQIANASLKLSDLYERSGDMGKSLKYYKNYISYRDSVNNLKSVQEMGDLRTDFEVSQKQTEVNVLNRQKKLWRVLLIASLVVLFIIVGLVIKLLKNNRQKQRAYILLRKEKDITDQQRDQTKKALLELEAAQSQLIHRERMASLGELTAGIAHEIQNPLNFVNNFSDVNAELLDELQQELQNGNVVQALSISQGVKENEQKINYHGKRADGIVKGMLQHSRPSTGQKELTNINMMANECLKLSYHGMRAKDKNFNATIETHFDEKLPKINIVPQDISRLLLNLCNNAFYAVAEKEKSGDVLYKPMVSVTTQKTGDNIEIIVQDNGTGIPKKIVDKIFNPFFTTKPPGQGTGLGLSISYDIIKGHGGTIDTDTKEGEFAEFTIRLPIDA